MPRIGVIAGLESELSTLDAVMAGDDAPLVRASGARPKLARDGARALVEMGVDGLLSYGTAGGLAPDARPGRLVVASRVVVPGGGTIATDRAWTENITRELGLDALPMAAADVVVNAGAKAALHAETGAVAVDMESHVVAEVAQGAGLPFAVLRCVTDPVEAELPGFVIDSVRPDGSVSLLPIVAGLCLRPWTIKRLLDLGDYNRTAMEALSGAVGILGPGFGLLAR